MLQHYSTKISSPPKIETTGRQHDARAFDPLDGMDRDDLSEALLEALVAMASRSKRRQADLSAALQRSGIKAGPDEVRAAVIQLQSNGCIRELVPLYDGGMLVTVTNMGMDRTGPNPRWRFLEKLSPLSI